MVQFNITPDSQYLDLIDGDPNDIKVLKKAFNPYKPGYMHSPLYKMKVWDGKENFWNDGKLSIGFYKELEDCCNKNDITLSILNIERFPKNKVKKSDVWDFCDDYYKDHLTKDGVFPFTPREYQREAVHSLLKGRYSMIEVATGGGKSLIFSTFCFYLLKQNPLIKILLVVPSVSLVRQFYNDMHDYCYGYNKEAINTLDIRVEEMHSQKPIIWNDPKRLKKEAIEKKRLAKLNKTVYKEPAIIDTLPNIVIGTFQSLCKQEAGWFKQFSVIAVDEGHTAKSNSIASIFNYCKHCEYRIGMSGTFPNTGMSDWFRIQSLIGPILYKVPAFDLIQEGAISSLHINGIGLKHDDEDFINALGGVASGDGARAFQLEKLYAQRSIKRSIWIADLCNSLKGNTLVMFHIIEYGEKLLEIIKQRTSAAVFYIDGMTPAEDREYIISQMNVYDDTPRILVATYGTLSTGISIDAIYNIVFAESFKEQKLIRQTIGRGLRKHADKIQLQVWDIVDIFYKKKPYKNIMWKQWEARTQIYASQKFSWKMKEYEL